MGKAEQGAPSAHEPKHTPGPWRYIDPRESPVGKRRPPEVVDANNNRVAQIDTRRERHDNGALIAAAPDLYEALRRMLADVQSYQRNPGGHSPTSVVADAIAALARARGDSK